jgi:eukaryotic-like serine/threonine-protein kinase
MTIPIGQLIANRYEVLDSLASAAQGDVYRVRDTYENATCVLKLLNVATLTAGLWDEAQILRDLADDHILEIRNADLYAGQPYIVTALAEHGTLETELAATSGLGLDVDQVITWIRQASMGVARAHDKSLVHNDIKPANLFLTANKECLVGDFGLASRVPPVPMVGVARGATAETAAPEVRAGWATGVPPAAFTTDVYSLGATAYWLLAAQPPVNLAGINGTAARMAAAAAQTTSRLRDVVPHVPAPVASIVERAMAVDPANRYQTVADFSAALGSRSTKPRRWRRTNRHPGHLGCWVGESPGKSTYILCLEQGATAKQCTVTTRHATGAKVPNGSRAAPMRDAAQAVRAMIHRLS